MNIGSPQVSVETGGQDFAGGSLIVEVFTEDSDIGVAVGVEDDLRSDEIVLFDETEGRVEGGG